MHLHLNTRSEHLSGRLQKQGLTLTRQCELGEVVSGVSPGGGKHGDGGVGHTIAVRQVQTLQLRQVALQ